MRIHIIGCSGSGKSALAKKIAIRLHIKHYDLDDIFWNNGFSYGKKREENERQSILTKILSEDNTILEGVYFNWCYESFKMADYIIVLNTPYSTCNKRITKRFWLRKLHLIKEKKESFSSFRKLKAWNKNYYNVTEKEYISLLNKNFGNKVFVLKTNRDIEIFMGQFIEK